MINAGQNICLKPWTYYTKQSSHRSKNLQNADFSTDMSMILIIQEYYVILFLVLVIDLVL